MFGSLDLKKRVDSSRSLFIPSIIEGKIPPMKFQKLIINDVGQNVLFYFDVSRYKFTTRNIKHSVPIHAHYLETEKEYGSKFPFRVKIKSINEFRTAHKYFKENYELKIDRRFFNMTNPWFAVDEKVCTMTSYADSEKVFTCNHLALVRDFNHLVTIN